jgi:hypothetical protein
MAKRQTRRSVSIKGATYLRAKALAAKNADSVSNLLERLIANACDAAEIRKFTRDEAIAARAPATPAEEIIRAHFTF